MITIASATNIQVEGGDQHTKIYHFHTLNLDFAATLIMSFEFEFMLSDKYSD